MNAVPLSYGFGEFVFRRDDMRLLRNGAPVPFNRQSSEVLIYLIDHRDRIVTRAELIDRFWARAPSGADDRLNSCIRRIRAAIDIDGAAASQIEIRPRLGYRFTGAVETLAEKPGAKNRFWARWPRMPRMPKTALAGAAACAGVVAPVLLLIAGVSEAPDSIYSSHGYEVQKFGDISSSCDFAEGSDFGECSMSGAGTVRFLYDGEEVMRTDVPKGTVLRSMHEAGSVRIKMSKPLPSKAG